MDIFLVTFTVLAWVLLLGAAGVKARDFLRGQQSWGPFLLLFLSSLAFITVASTQFIASRDVAVFPGMTLAAMMMLFEPAMMDSKKKAGPGQPETLVEAIDRLTAARAAGQITHEAAAAELETSHGQTPTAAEILLGEPAAPEPTALPQRKDPA